MEFDEVAENEVVEYYQYGAAEAEEEWRVLAVATLAVEAPNRVPQQDAAERHEHGAYLRDRHSEGGQVGRNGIGVDREALAIGAERGRGLRQGVE